MPRLKRASLLSKARAAKMHKRKVRALNRELQFNELEYEQKERELESMKNNASMFLSSYTPEWTESNDDSQSLQSNDKGDHSNMATAFSSSMSQGAHPSKANLGIKQMKKECVSSLKEENLELDFIADIKVEQDTDLVDDVKEEPDSIDGRSKMAGSTGDQMAQSTEDAFAGVTVDPLSGVEVDDENFVVDCDPMIVANPSLSSDVNNLLSSDEDSNHSFSSSSNNLLFADIMKNNEILYKQMTNCPDTMNDADLARALQEHYDKMEFNDETYEKRQKAALIQRRRRKKMLDRMTDDQLTEYRAQQTEACRLRRVRRLERMSEEEKQRDRMLKNALCLARRHRRESMMSDNERKERRAAAAAAQREKRRRKRQSMSEGELKAHKAEVASIWRMRRHLRYMKMSDEERQAERAKAAEAKRISRQRQKDDSAGESPEKPPPPKKPRRKKARVPTLSESESEMSVSNNFGMESTSESLISQILKQTQHIAAMESQGDPSSQHPLLQLAREHLPLPAASAKTYLLPHEIPDKDSALEPTPKVTEETYLLPHEIPDKDAASQKSNPKSYLLPHEQPEREPDVGHQSEGVQEKDQQTYLLPNEIPDPPDTEHQPEVSQGSKQKTYSLPLEIAEDQESKQLCPKVEDIKHESYLVPHELPNLPLSAPIDLHINKVAQNEAGLHNEIPQEFHHGRDEDEVRSVQQYPHGEIPRDGHPVMPQFYPHPTVDGHPANPGQFFNKAHLEAQQHLHHRPQDSDPIRLANPYHHGTSPYDHRAAAALHQYHLSNIPGIDRTGQVQHFHQAENEGNQSGALQQYLHGRNYMNSLY